MANPEGSSASLYMRKGHYLPQEEMLEIGKTKKKLKIGIPKENHKIENRVALTPEAIEILIEKGHEVLVQSGAGKQASYLDKNYY